MTINTPNNGIDEIRAAAFCQNTRKLPCVPNPNGQVTARSMHPGGVNAALCDGSVRFVPNTIERTVWQATSTRSGGETVTFSD